jgi:3-hydroxyisobutyrate dehydrogenase
MDVIGFIGLGHMGAPMVRNLVNAGKTVWIYDVVPQAMHALCDINVKAATSLAQLASEADIVLTSLQTSQQVNEVCVSPQGVFAHAKSNLLYIDCSSIDITTTQHLHQEAKKRKIAMLDAPVSGGVAGAIAGSLTFMVGGSESNFQRALPLLKYLAKKIIHAGQPGHGQAAKMCNNMLLGVSMIGVCEAFILAQKLGLDAKKFFEISSNASGQCWSMTSYCPAPGVLENVPSNHHYEPGFMAKMMLKDLHLAQHAADSVETFVPLGALATKLYELYVKQGYGEKDFSGIINFLANKKETT